MAANEVPNVSVVDLKDLFCDNDECSIAPFGVNLYRDKGHLNFNGSKYAAKFLLGRQ